MTSFFVKHSSAADGEETRTTGRKPNRRERIGPWVSERADRVRGSGFFKRCKWPSIGRAGEGLGGRFLYFWMKCLATKYVKMMMREMYGMSI